ncbi:MAG: peptidoglycan-associated lipoprotein Pal [Rickettsia sp.]|nr:peptidoglycan-associated lipoprotein Pal [Rickettsia sp.]
MFKNVFLGIFFLPFLILSGCGDKVRNSSDSIDLEQQIEEISSSVSAFENTVIDRVLFDFDSFTIKDSQAKELLNTQAEWLKENNATNIILEGHCDERGTKDYNIALGEKRAHAVKDFLVFLGVNPDYIRVVSYGKEKPAYIGHDEYSWKNNRRVVTVVLSVED